MASLCGIDDDDSLPSATWVATVKETQRLDDLEDEREENAPRVKPTHAARRRSEASACMCGFCAAAGG